MRNQLFLLAASVAFSASAGNIDSYENMYVKPMIARGLVDIEVITVTSEAVVGKSYELLTIALSDGNSHRQIGRPCAFKTGSTKAFTDGAGKIRIAPNAVCPP